MVWWIVWKEDTCECAWIKECDAVVVVREAWGSRATRWTEGQETRCECGKSVVAETVPQFLADALPCRMVPTTAALKDMLEWGRRTVLCGDGEGDAGAGRGWCLSKDRNWEKRAGILASLRKGVDTSTWRRRLPPDSAPTSMARDCEGRGGEGHEEHVTLSFSLPMLALDRTVAS
jgi:hypothetical protein